MRSELITVGTIESWKAQGYHLQLTGRTSWQRGYVSRKKENDGFLYRAGGRRAGQYFILVPSFTSTRYCYRFYVQPVYVGKEGAAC